MSKFNKLKRLFFNLATSGTFDELELIPRSRLIFANAVVLAGIPILWFYSFHDLYKGKLLPGIPVLVASLLILTIFLITRAVRCFNLLRYVVAGVLFSLFLYLGYTGGTESTGILWVLTYPIMSQFLMGARMGTVVGFFLWGLMACILYIPSLNIVGISPAFAARFLGGYITIWIFSVSYQISMEQTQLKLASTSKKLADEKEQTDSIMNHVEQGLFLLEEDFRVGESHSKSLTDLLMKEHPEGARFLDILAPHLSKQDFQAAADYLDMFYRNDVNPDLLKEINPLEQILLKDSQGEEKILRFSFGQVAREMEKPAILGIVSDITEEKRLQDQLKLEEENYSRNMEHLFQIIHISPPMLQDFLDQSKVDMQHINSLMKAHNSEITELLSQVFQILHSIKGNAQLLGLKTLAEQLHQLEENVREMQDKDTQWDDLLDLTISLGGFQQGMGEIEDLVDRIRRFSQGENLTLNQDDQEAEHSHLLKALSNLTLQEAKKQGKKVRLDVSSLQLDIFDKSLQSVIRDVSTQMIRNSLAHGVEEPNDRSQAGKTAEGTITLSSCCEKGQLIFQYRDDGAGIDLDAIRKRLEEKNIDPKRMTTGELLRQIFEPGFSTNPNSDMSSGRGVGMNVIKDRVRKAGGKIKMASKPGQYTQFSFIFPTQQATA